jgi:hypothetical protein
MASSNPRLADDYAPKGRKVGFIRLSDALGSATTDYADILVVDGVPSGAYGRDSGASMLAIRKDAADADSVLYQTADGGTTWSAASGAAALADPGDAAAIPVTRSASIAITTAAAETNTLAIPTFVGQVLHLICDVYAVGDRVVTVAAKVNQTGNNTLTFGAAGDFISLLAVQEAGTLRWQVAANDGVGVSTV